MLKLYTGRENINKESFIYESIRKAGGEALVIVPNQYTLVAEEQALKYLGKDCLFNVEILSMNRLGLRILSEQGLESTRMLDRNGRFMLLSRIVNKNKDELEIFKTSVGKVSFTNMLNDFISSFKQQECSIDEIKNMIDGDSEVLLKEKLSELELILNEYEKAIEGKYTDSEDYISMYVSEIHNSSLIHGKDIWIYAYDSITPKFLRAMLELAANAKSVNFIVNETDFELDKTMLRTIYAEAAKQNIPVEQEAIGEEYVLNKCETVARIERGLWNNELTEEEIENNAAFVPEDLTIVRAVNPYYEAESTAAYIWHLVRDLGYKMHEIQLIANNEERLQPIIRRTLIEYGLPVFLDSSRSISDATAVSFVVNLLLFLKYKDGTAFILDMLKTGLTDISYEDVEDLENYVRTYKIKGSMWRRPFKYGAEQYGEESFNKIEGLRQQIMEPLTRLEELARAATVGEFVDSFKKYIDEEWKLGERLEEISKAQIERGLVDEALRDVQSYKKALELLDQMNEIMGDESFEIAEFFNVYTNGLLSVEVGVIPPTMDGLSLGTMIRTRPRPVRAIVVIGANEGILPLQPSTEGLFSIDEKKFFRDAGFALGRLDDIKVSEENAAMYRMLSKASDKLYISYSMADADGAEAEPSQIIDALKELFPAIREKDMVQEDVISAGWNSELVNSPQETMRHFINHIKDKNGSRKMDGLSAALMTWLEQNDEAKLEKMIEAALDENTPKPIGKELATSLYSRRDGSLVLSASSIDNYFKCPFKYFVENGLKPQEERTFASDPRSIGSVYHECLMKVARKVVTNKSYGRELADMDDEELKELVSKELDKIAETYEGGLFISTGNEEYRMDRIKETCAIAVRSIAEQLSSIYVTSAEFEENFGRGYKFRPLEFDIDGQKVYVEGKIDRADTICNLDLEDRVRIIDYKTGNDTLDTWKMSHGYKMQLMIYMIAADVKYKPAGMFYLNIKDKMDSYDGKNKPKYDYETSEYIEEEKEPDTYKLSGVYIDEEGVLEAMPESVLPKKKNKISFGEYKELRKAVGDNIREIAEGIVEGRIDIYPFKDNKKLVCNYCQYKSICKRDREYVNNLGWELPPKPNVKKKENNKCN